MLNKLKKLNLINIVIYLMILNIFFITPFLQLQMLTIGRVIVKGAHINLIILSFSIIELIIKVKKREVDKSKLGIISMVSLLYLVLSFLFRITIYDVEYFAYLINANVYIIVAMIFLIIEFNLGDEIKKNIKKIFKIILGLNIIISFVQLITNSLIYPYSYDQNGVAILQIGGFNETGMMRITGTFSSGLKLAIFLGFIIIYMFNKFLYEKVRINKLYITRLILFTVVIVQFILTFTRNIYAIVLYCVLLLVLIKTKNKLCLYITKWIPVIFPFVYLIGISVILPLLQFSNNKLLLSQSVLSRFSQWNIMIREYIDFTFIQKLFGKFYYQLDSGKADQLGVRAILVDNFFINTLIFIGAIGLLVIVVFLIGLYFKIFDEFIYKNNVELVFLSSLFSFGMLNLFEEIFLFFAIIIPIIIYKTKTNIKELGGLV